MCYYFLLLCVLASTNIEVFAHAHSHSHSNHFYYNSHTFYGSHSSDIVVRLLSSVTRLVSGYHNSENKPGFDFEFTLTEAMPNASQSDSTVFYGHLVSYISELRDYHFNEEVHIPDLCAVSGPHMGTHRVTMTKPKQPRAVQTYLSVTPLNIEESQSQRQQKNSRHSRGKSGETQTGFLESQPFQTRIGHKSVHRMAQTVPNDGLWVAVAQVCPHTPRHRQRQRQQHTRRSLLKGNSGNSGNSSGNHAMSHALMRIRALKHAKHARYVRHNRTTVTATPAEVRVIGVTIVGRNEFGYENGEMLPSIPAVLGFFAFYCAFVAVWAYLLYVQHRGKATTYQHLLLLALVWALLECALQLAVLSLYNNGEWDSSHSSLREHFEALHVLCSVALHVYVRVLFALLSFGVGVTTLFRDLHTSAKARTLAFAVVYAMALSALHWAQCRNRSRNNGNITGATVSALTLEIVPLTVLVSALEGVYCYAIFDAFSRLFDSLRESNQFYKYGVYRRLALALFAAMLCSCVLLCALFHCTGVSLLGNAQNTAVRDPRGTHSYFLSFYWCSDGLWRLLFASVALYVCSVLAPNDRSKLFVMSQQIPTQSTLAKRSNWLTPAVTSVSDSETAGMTANAIETDSEI